MRLDILEHGHRPTAKAFQRVAAWIFRHELDDVAKTAMHRPAFWGRPFFELGSEVLRGPSFWTPGEREYLAAFSSRLNQCPFCVRVHTETTRIESRGEVDIDQDSPGRPELAAVLPLLEKVSQAPDTVSSADIARVREAGLPEEAIVDALYVNFIFNTVNRMANAFGWSWESDDHARAAAKAIHRFRYQLPGFVMR